MTEQPSNKTEFISTFPAGEQVPVAEVHSSKTLESRRGKKQTKNESSKCEYLTNKGTDFKIN